MKEGEDILKKTARKYPSLQQAVDTWGEISFNYESTDTPDVTPKPMSCGRSTDAYRRCH